MKTSKVCFTQTFSSLKMALQDFGLSGQFIKKHLNSSQRNLKIESLRPLQLSPEILNHNMINPEYVGPEIKVLNENDEFLAIEKPHRVHAYPLNYFEQDNVLSFLRSTGKGKMLRAFEEYADRNLLFRLDYETAGVLLFYKASGDLSLLRQLKENQKIYTIAIKGNFTGRGHFKNYYSASGPKGEKVTCYSNEVPNSRMGELEVLHIDYVPEYDLSLVMVSLKTGVRHQIRSFFKSLGHPILGDGLYGGAEHPCLCLHATYYKVGQFHAFSKPLFFNGDFLNLYSRFKVLCDQIGIG